MRNYGYDEGGKTVFISDLGLWRRIASYNGKLHDRLKFAMYNEVILFHSGWGVYCLNASVKQGMIRKTAERYGLELKISYLVLHV